VLHKAAPFVDNDTRSLHEVVKVAWHGGALVSMILAAVLFNIFEYTDLARRFRRWVDWRGALAVGLVTGLASIPMLNEIERIIPPVPAVQTTVSPTGPPSPTGSLSPSIAVSPSPTASPAPGLVNSPQPGTPASTPFPTPVASTAVNPAVTS